jgi:hypothetical protein
MLPSTHRRNRIVGTQLLLEKAVTWEEKKCVLRLSVLKKLSVNFFFPRFLEGFRVPLVIVSVGDDGIFPACDVVVGLDASPAPRT